MIDKRANAQSFTGPENQQKELVSRSFLAEAPVLIASYPRCL